MTALMELAVMAAEDTEEDREAWIVEQIEYLVDEWFERRRLNQDRWEKALCPWCRRLSELNMSHLRCPICAQIRRTRKEDDG